MNAWVLGKKMDGDFAFDWPTDRTAGLQEHAITEARDVFSEEFLNAYRQEPSGNYISIASKEFAGPGPRDGRFLSEPINLIERLPQLNVSFRDYGLAFAAIGFSQRMQAAIDAAQDYDIGRNVVAAHLRAGDIIYGRYRFDDRFTSKVVPYPLIEHALDTARKQNRELLVFGQDDALCDHLAKTFGARRPFYSEEKDLQALFEISLMSRCHTIYCGASGFAELACKIGGSTQLDPRRNMATTEMIDTMRANLAADIVGISDLQRSFAYWHCYHSGRGTLTTVEQADVMFEACRLDPLNDFYKVVLASVLFSDGRLADAEKVLDGCSGKNIDGALWRVLRPAPNGANRATRFLKAYQSAAEGNCYMASLCLAIHDHFAGQKDSARHHLARCQTISPGRNGGATRRLSDLYGPEAA